MGPLVIVGDGSISARCDDILAIACNEGVRLDVQALLGQNQLGMCDRLSLTGSFAIVKDDQVFLGVVLDQFNATESRISVHAPWTINEQQIERYWPQVVVSLACNSVDDLADQWAQFVIAML